MGGKSSIGRGRLSSIDMLPPSCSSDVRWARKQLLDRKIPQTLILQELNFAIEGKGVKRISKGAFSRWSVAQIKRGDSIIDEAASFVVPLNTPDPISGLFNRLRAAFRIIWSGTL